MLPALEHNSVTLAHHLLDARSFPAFETPVSRQGDRFCILELSLAHRTPLWSLFRAGIGLPSLADLVSYSRHALCQDYLPRLLKTQA